jgi:dihydropteroate synthase
VISLKALADLAAAHPDAMTADVTPVTLGSRTFDTDREPIVMGCVNLSRDSVYRDSIAVTTEAAIRKGTVLAAQGAHVVDVGAESSTAKAERVTSAEQSAVMIPVVEALTEGGVSVSVETYHPDVARNCLKAGAVMVNYSGGTPNDEAMFAVVAEYGAALVLCFIPGTHARDPRSLGGRTDLLPVIHEDLAPRVALARSCGVGSLIVDPGIGFSLDASAGPIDRIRQQTRTLLSTFRLRTLGQPVCQALPNAFDIFEDQFRTAEGFFTVLAHLGGCGMYRTHEVAHITRVLRALHVLPVP